MQVKITIGLGNDAMQTGHDVARALRDLATRFERDDGEAPPRGTYGIRDLNGNTVGSARVMR